MRSATDRSDTKLLRYAIGAGTLVLALMLFSQVSCSIMGYCADWFGFPVLGFWEILGIFTAILFGYFSIRALLQLRTDRPDPRSQPPHNDAVPQSETRFAPPSFLDDSEEIDGDRDSTIQGKARERWQSFCERLSDEEKHRLRSMLEQRVITPGSTNSSGSLPSSGRSSLSSRGSESRTP